MIRPGRTFLIAATAVTLGACTTTTLPEGPSTHPGIEWVRTAAEFDALALQAYGMAGRALEEKVADTSWSALPEQTDAARLPPAIIYDVDETVVSNVEFQLSFVPPFSDEKLNDWNANNKATAIPGVAEFSKQARDLGVTLFFLTNRPCMPSGTDPCPQKAVTVGDINEAGIPVGPEHVMLSYEQPGWNKEKKNRRDVIAKDYRVIMLMGDDLGDFIPCSRHRAVTPCGEGATMESRNRATEKHVDYWGNGWYILPNPMHGSWTTVRQP
ncbi:MAG: HAD family acid phosphatase [Woeseia sp.]